MGKLHPHAYLIKPLRAYSIVVMIKVADIYLITWEEVENMTHADSVYVCM